MKTIIMALTILLSGSTATFAQAKQVNSNKHQKTKITTKYTCEMHPEVVKTKPGRCPKCGMNLTAMKKTTSTKKTITKS